MSVDTTTTWGQLLAIALVGTERKAEPTDEVLQRAALVGGSAN